MISVNDALNIIEIVTKTYEYEKVSLNSALNLVLSEDILSPINMPPFRQSAMDGYAIKWGAIKTYDIIEESKAGDAINHKLNEGEAIRIFTGALVPDNADTVIIQEQVKKTNGTIFIKNMPDKFANIRKTAEQIKKGEIALKKGMQLNAASIGFLACLGITEVSVYKIPKVCILVTGNELQKAGSNLEIGKIYESNSIMLKSALIKVGVKHIDIIRVKDDYEATKKSIQTALKKNNILLISGGISVGDYDFAKAALLANNVDELFYKVNQKPGKPLWFGKKDKTFVFALPGNPASALTCFYIYVVPLLRNLSGYKNIHLEKAVGKSTSHLINTTGKTLFLKANLTGTSVEFLQGQSSAMMHSFALSNVLVCIDESTKSVKKNDTVECIKLDF